MNFGLNQIRSTSILIVFRNFLILIKHNFVRIFIVGHPYKLILYTLASVLYSPLVVVREAIGRARMGPVVLALNMLLAVQNGF